MVVNQDNISSKITVSCPSGHRLRGDITLSGSTVRCPKCQQAFVFAPSSNEAGHPAAAAEKHSRVTDTGVMRILGESEPLPPLPEHKPLIERACPRCSLRVSPEATVCRHCNCYIGAMPQFMQQMMPGTTGTPRRG